jgi:hypothetical protein
LDPVFFVDNMDKIFISEVFLCVAENVGKCRIDAQEIPIGINEKHALKRILEDLIAILPHGWITRCGHSPVSPV